VAGYTTFSAPAIGGVVALDAATGHRRWLTVFPRGADASLATGWAGGPVFTDRFIAATSSDGRIHAFDPQSGKIRWSIPRVTSCAAAPGSPERDFRPLFYINRTLFAGSLTGCVVAYDADTRHERWKYSSEEDGSTAFIIGADGQDLYVPYARGRVSAISQ